MTTFPANSVLTYTVDASGGTNEIVWNTVTIQEPATMFDVIQDNNIARQPNHLPPHLARHLQERRFFHTVTLHYRHHLAPRSRPQRIGGGCCCGVESRLLTDDNPV